jgi:hypothetical protein
MRSVRVIAFSLELGADLRLHRVDPAAMNRLSTINVAIKM